MKYSLWFCFFLIIFTSCKTKKAFIDTNAIAEKVSAKKVARKHIAANFDKKTVEAKIKAKVYNGKKLPSVSVTLRIIKDEVIWLKASKFITVFKAKITPEKVSFYSPLEKKYFEGDFSSLEKILGAKINFEQLQNLLLGQAIQNVKKQKQIVEIVDNSYVLSPEVQANFFDIFFTVNPSHFKLDRQSIVNSKKNQRLDIIYPNYKIIENEIFPTQVFIKAKQNKKYTNIDLTYKTVKFNIDVNTTFKIPSNYKRINLK